MKSMKIQTGFILPLIVLLGAVAWFFIYHQPTQKKIGNVKRELTALKEKIKKDVPETIIQSVARQSDSLSAALESRKMRIFPYSDLINFGDAVQPVAKKYGLTLVSLKPDYKSLAILESDTSEVCELPISIETEGKFEAFAKFANDLSVLPFALRVDEFFIERIDKQTGQINFEIKGVVFLRKAAVKPTGGGGGPSTPLRARPL